jgi:hypothetical protein
MWEPRCLTTLSASMTCYRDSFTFLFMFTSSYPWVVCITPETKDEFFVKPGTKSVWKDNIQNFVIFKSLPWIIWTWDEFVGNLKRGGYSDLRVNRGMILRFIYNKLNEGVWSRLNWFKAGTNSRKWGYFLNNRPHIRFLRTLLHSVYFLCRPQSEEAGTAQSV